MITLLIVEDEQIIREGIVDTIDWYRHGIEICGQAINGADGLEKMKQFQPDILFTDIRMPLMDGLELVRQAKDAGLQFEFILLSGFNDFAYAQQGIQLGAVDFTLKPCRPEAILKSVLEAKSIVEKKQKEQKSINQLKYTWDQNIPLVKWQTLSHWMRHPKKPLENRYVRLDELHMAIAPQFVHIGIVRIERTQFHTKYTKDYDIELIRFATMNILIETMAPIYGNLIEAFRDTDDLLWCANITHTPSLSELKAQLYQLQQNLEKYLDVSVSIGIGNRCESVDFVHVSYKEALDAADTRFYEGNRGIFFYSEIEKTYKQKDNIFIDEGMTFIEIEMINHIRMGQYSDSLDKMETWLNHLRKNPQYGRNEVNLKSSTFIVELQKLAQEHKVSNIEWKNQMINWVEQQPHIETLEDLSIILKKIFQSLVEILNTKTPIHRTIQAALEIIHDRYNSNLTLDIVAKEVFVSNTYLSSLFKQEIGTNFLDYLHQYRVNKAKQLLQENYKVYMVAKLVGYQEERHFSSTFKKWTGLTPSQFQRGR
jgi:two-component system response regulator YesN